jgi:hypothetical protein
VPKKISLAHGRKLSNGTHMDNTYIREKEITTAADIFIKDRT